jgi:hypothetical protein
MGHGWVTPNIDGSKARCGGPGMCEVCNKEQLIVGGNPMVEVVEPSQDWHMQAGQIIENPPQLEISNKYYMPVEAQQEIASVINKYSLERHCDIPDFAIAAYLAGCYTSLCVAAQQKVNWSAPDSGLEGL